MKRRNSILFTFLIVLACSEDEAPAPFPILASVFFEGASSLIVKESDEDLIEIPIKLSEAQETPLLISYDVIGEEVLNGSDFEILSSNPLTIPAGSLTGSISIQINNNEIVQPEERKIFIRFRSLNPSEVQIKTPKEVIITIKEDDCPITSPKTNIWVGSLIVQDEVSAMDGTGSVDLDDICTGKLSVEAKFFGEVNPTSTVVMQLVQGSSGSEMGTVSVTRFKLFSGLTQFEYEAIGTYDEIAKKIILDYSLFDINDSAGNFTGTHIILAN